MGLSGMDGDTVAAAVAVVIVFNPLGWYFLGGATMAILGWPGPIVGSECGSLKDAAFRVGSGSTRGGSNCSTRPP